MNRKTPTPTSTSERDLQRSAITIDTGWDELGPDPLDGLAGIIDQTLFEDRDW